MRTGVGAIPPPPVTCTGGGRSLSDSQLRISVHRVDQNLILPHLRQHLLPMRPKLGVFTSRMMRRWSVSDGNKALDQSTPVVLPMQADSKDPVAIELLPRLSSVESFAGSRIQEESEPEATSSEARRHQSMMQEHEVLLLIPDKELRLREPPGLGEHRHMDLEALHVSDELVHFGVGTIGTVLKATHVLKREPNP